MKKLKHVLQRASYTVGGVMAGLTLGLWFGMNLGKEQPILSNPFKEVPIQHKIKSSVMEKSGSLLEDTGDFLRDTGKAIKEKVES